MTNQIKTVLVADTTLHVKNEVKPVTTSNTTSKMFKSHSDVHQHELDMYDATSQINDKNSDYKIVDEHYSALKYNNNTAELFVEKTVLSPQVTTREVKISDLTAEQKVEFENLYNMKIVEETFPNKVVEFKTKSKIYVVEKDNSDEASIEQSSIDSLVDNQLNEETVQ